jgi:hypothetical protein
MRVTLLSLAGQLLFAATGLAQDCVTFHAIPESASLTVVRRPFIESSASPMHFCSMKAGEKYTLLVRAYGYETRRLRFGLSSRDQSVSLSGVRAPYLTRSLFVPGLGQYQAGYSGALSTWTFFLAAVSVVYSVQAFKEYSDTKDTSESLRIQALLSTTQADRERLAKASFEQSVKANSLEEYFISTVALAGWIYAWNLVDTYLITKPPSTSVEGSTVTVKTPRRSNGRATFRSIFFPGMGQIYLGSEVKGTIIQIGFITAAVWAIESTKEYNFANDRYELAKLELAAASTGNELQNAERKLNQAISDRDNNTALRDAAYIALGSVWLLNVIDAAFADGATPSSRQIGLETSYRNSVLRTGIRYRF